MSSRRWFAIACCAVASVCVPQPNSFGQSDPASAEQVRTRYLMAIGGTEKIAGITTFSEKGEISGNFENSGRMYHAPSRRKETGTFEFYFKTPNLRFESVLRENQTISYMYGCDGAVFWYIGSDAVRHEFKPTPANQYKCISGYEPLPFLVPVPNARLQLKGKKKVGDRIAWVVRAEDFKANSVDIYYFDAETFLLLRWDSFRQTGLASVGGEIRLNRSYSDYRDVGGIKLPFMIVQDTDSLPFTTILREVQINTPLENSRFEEPQVTGGTKNRQVVYGNTPIQQPAPAVSLPSTHLNRNQALATITFPDTQLAPPAVSYSVTTDFASSSATALQELVPELKGLKPAPDQQPLIPLLDKIGARTTDLSRKIPNLISHEQVVQSQPGTKPTSEGFSYLIVAHQGKDAVTLEEFRVDLKTGATIETGDVEKPGAPNNSSTHFDELIRASERASTRTLGGPPLSLGFASMWVRFYPSNRSESEFRYLGQQKMDGHRTYVVAFAQKPGSVRLPGELRFKDRTVPVYYQGIAWVDESDFRILRLRTDLLPTADLPLTQLTAEIQFADTQAAGFATPLWLPREVLVTSLVNGLSFRNKHSYSNYRSFQTHSRILLSP